MYLFTNRYMQLCMYDHFKSTTVGSTIDSPQHLPLLCVWFLPGCIRMRGPTRNT